MRTREEVERAIRHLKQALSSPIAQKNEAMRYLTLIQIDMLQWMTGEDNGFEEVLRGMDEIDERVKRAERQ